MNSCSFLIFSSGFLARDASRYLLLASAGRLAGIAQSSTTKSHLKGYYLFENKRGYYLFGCGFYAENQPIKMRQTTSSVYRKINMAKVTSYKEGGAKH